METPTLSRLLLRLLPHTAAQVIYLFDNDLQVKWTNAAQKQAHSLKDVLPDKVVELCQKTLETKESQACTHADEPLCYRIHYLGEAPYMGCVFAEVEQSASEKKLQDTIRELQEANQLAQQREKRLKGTINGASEGILILNDDATINFQNRVARQLFCLPEAGDTNFIELIHQEDQAEVAPFFLDEDNRKSLKREVCFRAIGQSEIFLGELSLSKIVGQNTEFVAIIEDISERKAAEEKLKQANEALKRRERELSNNAQKLTRANRHLENTLTALKNTQVSLIQAEKMSSLGQLTAGIAHELNNPINFMFAGVQALQANFDDLLQFIDQIEQLLQNEGDKQPERLAVLRQTHDELDISFLREDTERLLNDVQEGADRTANIVKGLLTFSRMNEENYQAIKVEDSIRSTLNILRGQLRGRIQVTQDFDPETPRIEGLAGKINQVFMNVIVNAADAIQEKGEIYIQTQRTKLDEREAVCITIRDTGGGIPEALRTKIFDPFFTTKDVGKGTGLGLYISHGIIERHNGKIELESTEGEGTSFRIYLPVRQEEGN